MGWTQTVQNTPTVAGLSRNKENKRKSDLREKVAKASDVSTSPLSLNDTGELCHPGLCGQLAEAVCRGLPYTAQADRTWYHSQEWLAFTGEPGSSHRGCVPVVFKGHSPPLTGRRKMQRKEEGSRLVHHSQRASASKPPTAGGSFPCGLGAISPSPPSAPVPSECRCVWVPTPGLAGLSWLALALRHVCSFFKS